MKIFLSEGLDDSEVQPQNLNKYGDLSITVAKSQKTPNQSKGRQSDQAVAYSNWNGSVSGDASCPRPSILHFSVLDGTGKVYAVDHKFSVVGPSRDQSTKSSNSLGFIPTLPRVSKLKRRETSLELVLSDEPSPNCDHPLASLSSADRQRQRLLKLAEILAHAAARRAARLASSGKEAG